MNGMLITLSDPRSVVPESIMPKYEFLLHRKLKPEDSTAVLVANRRVGVPYTDEMIEQSAADFSVQVDPDGDWEEMVARYPKAQVRNFDGQKRSDRNGCFGSLLANAWNAC